MIKGAILILFLCSAAAFAGDSQQASPPVKKPEEKLVITCMPSLVSVLWSNEQKKGALLTEHEVAAIRDAATAVALPASKVADVEKARGYKDINPDHAWEEWQAARLDLVKHQKENHTAEPGSPSRPGSP